VRAPPIRPLFVKELREILGGRALWTLLLLGCPLVGYSFFQAMSLYGEASAAAQQSPVLATSLSPLDGVLVPTFGSFYVAVTLLFPFVAIRARVGRVAPAGPAAVSSQHARRRQADGRADGVAGVRHPRAHGSRGVAAVRRSSVGR
jgi:hypothetical protein